MKRKLATIQKVSAVYPIKNADRLERVSIMGWECVTRKNDFKEGDIGVYFEVDSFLPIENRYEFLKKTSYQKNKYMGEDYLGKGNSEEGIRIKTMVLRGVLSQGLFLPIDKFPEIKDKDIEIGKDVTSLLGIRKWDKPEVEGNLGTVIGDRPHFIPKTNELRVQSSENILKHMTGKPYYISTKMEGTSCTIYSKDSKEGVSSRISEYKQEDSSGMWNYFIERDIPNKLNKLGIDIAIQGEFCGVGIQNNKLRLRNYEFFVFDIYDIERERYLSLDEMEKISQKLDLQTVPIEEVGESLDYNLSELIEKAKGNYDVGTKKEGIVVRTKSTEFFGEDNERQRCSFKVLNNEYLVEE